MRDVIGLDQHAVIGQACQFGEYALRIARRFWVSVKGEFLAPCRQAHAEVVFDQLEVPVVVSKQNGGVGTFSQFELSHEGPKPDPPLSTVM